jgi:hypothetical protein
MSKPPSYLMKPFASPFQPRRPDFGARLRGGVGGAVPVEPVTVPPIYVGGARLANWGHTAKGGMAVEFLIKEIGPREVNPFKGLRCGKSDGQRLRTWVGPYSEALEIAALDEVESVYAGETMLTYWGDTSSKGMTVKVLIDNTADGVNGRNPFADMQEGAVEGQDFFTSFWAIDDDESVVAKKAVRPRTPFYQLSEVKQANILTGDQEFVNFLARRSTMLAAESLASVASDVSESPRKWAEEIIRAILGIESRSVMNHETIAGVEARKKWKALVGEYFQSDEYHTRQPFTRP